MRKLKLQMQITADGFVAGPQGELDWMTWEMDEKLISFINDLTSTAYPSGIVVNTYQPR